MGNEGRRLESGARRVIAIATISNKCKFSLTILLTPGSSLLTHPCFFPNTSSKLTGS